MDVDAGQAALPFAEGGDQDEEAEYLRLKRAEEKAIRAQELKRLRERERQNWAPLMELPIRSAGAVPVGALAEATDLDKQLREERYYEITKPEPYKGTSVLE